MTNEANRLLDAAVKRVGLRSSFFPAEIGQDIGLDKHQAEAAARHLSNAGILELGFDCAATFSPEYKKLRSKDSEADRATSRRSRSSVKTRVKN
ncbi:MAG TPA: hypothetical protein VN541_06745 [Tepidisphaeraceae bacterium]|nr:hypothetical protein [Tepidisphaeraceae bacterium]